MKISIPIPSFRSDYLSRCLESLEKYSSYSHEILVVLDEHEAELVWKDFNFDSKKHKIRVLRSGAFPDLWDRHLKGESHQNKFIILLSALGIAQSFYDWILVQTDHDFYFLPEWDYHLSKWISLEKKLEYVYMMKQIRLCERPNPNQGAWFETKKDILKISHILKETKDMRQDYAGIEKIINRQYAERNPFLVHRELLMRVGCDSNLFKSMCNIWSNISFEQEMEKKFLHLDIKKVCPQNSVVIHSKANIALDI